jgi:hypothetical protein
MRCAGLGRQADYGALAIQDVSLPMSCSGLAYESLVGRGGYAGAAQPRRRWGHSTASRGEGPCRVRDVYGAAEGDGHRVGVCDDEGDVGSLRALRRTAVRIALQAVAVRPSTWTARMASSSRGRGDALDTAVVGRKEGGVGVIGVATIAHQASHWMPRRSRRELIGWSAALTTGRIPQHRLAELSLTWQMTCLRQLSPKTGHL